MDTEKSAQGIAWVEVFHKLARQRECVILEGHLCDDYAHMFIAILPKYSVAQVVGFMKGKSTIHLAREVEERARGYAGQAFWLRGYFVSSVGRDEKVIREHIRNQEKEDLRVEQLKFCLEAVLKAALSGSQV